MSAPSVHDKTGRSCAHCGKVFEKGHLNLTVSSKDTVKNLIIKQCVCGACHHKAHEIGE